MKREVQTAAKFPESTGIRHRSAGQCPYHFILTMEGQVLTDGTQVAAYLTMMKMKLMLAHTCIACGEIRDEEAIAERRTEIALFGGVMANLCPCCFRELGEDEREEVHATWAELKKDDNEDDRREYEDEI